MQGNDDTPSVPAPPPARERQEPPSSQHSPRGLVPDTEPSRRELAPEQLPALQQVGRYILLKQLGRGGMGVVYAAYDPDLDRKIALKLLAPQGQADPGPARARLLREAQAMARISHPNVISVFDVGLFSDQVFLAMELMDGGTLSAWLQQGQRTWQEVLEPFLAAGRGLAAAHSVGLVHRDFKPSNVLMSRAGRVCVTDFGLARQVGAGTALQAPLDTEETEPLSGSEHRMLELTLTAPGMVMGTPNYMSPEQVLGDELDARSDQFSFCAALYWALHGQRPFDPVRMRAAMRARAKAPGRALPPSLILEPPRESKVPAWVKQAVMRGLALEPTERFSSMEALLEALSQQRRLSRRRRGQAAAGVVAVGLLAVGGGVYQQSQQCAGAGQLMAEVWGPAPRQALESSFLATGSPLAAETAARVTQRLEAYANHWTRQRTEACEATRVQGVQPEELLARRVGCLERRRKDMRALVELLARADKPLVEKALEATHALPALQECAELEALSEQQRLPEDPLRRAEIERLEGQLAGVKALVDSGRFPAALEQVRQLEAPVRTTGHLPLMAELGFQRGWLEEQLGKPGDAVHHLLQALYDAQAGRADRLQVSILLRLIFVEDGQRQFEQAARWAGLAEATLRRLGGDRILEADVLVNRGNLEVSQGHFPQARALLERAQALYQDALEPGHPKRIRVTFLLGRVLVGMGEHARAVPLLDEALRDTQAALGRLHPDMARRHGALSWALRELGQYERALEHARAATEIRQALLGPESLPVAEGLDEVGQNLLGLRRYAEALQVYQQALEVKRKKLKPEDEPLQYSYDGVGQALLGLGRAREAVDALRRAVAFPSAPADVLAESGFALARALWEADQPFEAREEAARARERFTQAGQAPRAAEVEAWLTSLPKQRAPGPTRR